MLKITLKVLGIVLGIIAGLIALLPFFQKGIKAPFVNMAARHS